MRQTLIILTLLSALNAKALWTENGLGFNSGMHGSGMHWYYGYFNSESYGWSFEARLYDLKGENELPSYDPRYGTITTSGGISLVMITGEAGFMFFPFAGKIANNFSPFVNIQLGPNFIFDAPEEGGFLERWKQAQMYTALAGYVGLGVSFYISYKTVVSVNAGYDILILPKFIDGSDDYSGLLIKFTFSRRK